MVIVSPIGNEAGGLKNQTQKIRVRIKNERINRLWLIIKSADRLAARLSWTRFSSRSASPPPDPGSGKWSLVPRRSAQTVDAYAADETTSGADRRQTAAASAIRSAVRGNPA